MQKILITPDNMPEITFKFVKMDRETSEAFMQLSFAKGEDFKKLLKLLIKIFASTPLDTIFAFFINWPSLIYSSSSLILIVFIFLSFFNLH